MQDMEQPRKHPPAPEQQKEKSAGSTPEVAEKQIHRWKDDGGAVAPDPEPEPTRKQEDQL